MVVWKSRDLGTLSAWDVGNIEPSNVKNGLRTYRTHRVFRHIGTTNTGVHAFVDVFT